MCESLCAHGVTAMALASKSDPKTLEWERLISLFGLC